MGTVYKDRPCEGYEEDLILFHYGELDPVQTASTASHIETCAGCRVYMAELARLLAAVPEYVPGRAETRRAVDRVIAGIAPRRPVFGRRLVPAAIALAAFAFVTLFTVFRTPVSEGPPGARQAVMAQADPEVLENLDLLKNLDAMEELDTVQRIEEEL